MRWCNKGHELDSSSQWCLDFFNKKKTFYIFGAGINAYTLMHTLEHYGWLEALIDNNVQKQTQLYYGYKVLSLKKYLELRDDSSCVVIAATPQNTRVISEQLKDAGLEHNEDYLTEHDLLDRMLPIYSLYHDKMVYINLCQICLTERCTLKCKDCAHGCYAVDIKSNDDMTLDRAKKTVDCFFGKIGFISEFVLIGGEPLLYKNLAEMIEYVGENYKDKIGVLGITTNGTIIPDNKVLDYSRKYHVLYRISNYINSIPQLARQHDRLINKFKEYDIDYILGKPEEEWFDYGFGHYRDKDDSVMLIKKFDRCNTPCREIRDDKLYFCVMARSASDNLKMNIGKEDYLLLSSLSDDYNGYSIMTEYNLGYSDKGYLDMCQYCHGADACKYVVKAAEQMGK